MPSLALNVLVVYAILIAVGGVIGFVTGGSKVSLISGLISAAVLAVARYVASTNLTIGLGIAMVGAIVLAGVFGMRLRSTGKFMPAGMLVILSVVTRIVFAIGLAQS